MPIWGSKVRDTQIAQGQFFCPQCYELRPYTSKRSSKYFTLYSFPLFEIQKLGMVVECQDCHTRFDANILEPKNQVMFKVLAAARSDLRRGMSPAETKSKLLAMGLGDDVADVVLKLVQP